MGMVGCRWVCISVCVCVAERMFGYVCGWVSMVVGECSGEWVCVWMGVDGWVYGQACVRMHNCTACTSTILRLRPSTVVTSKCGGFI